MGYGQTADYYEDGTGPSDSGYDDGHSDGYEEGHKAGYDVGYEEGYEAGREVRSDDEETDNGLPGVDSGDWSEDGG